MPISRKAINQIKHIIDKDTEQEVDHLVTHYNDLRDSFREWVTFWMRQAEKALNENDPQKWREILIVIHGSMIGTIKEMQNPWKNYLSDPEFSLLDSNQDTEKEPSNVLSDQGQQNY